MKKKVYFVYSRDVRNTSDPSWRLNCVFAKPVNLKPKKLAQQKAKELNTGNTIAMVVEGVCIEIPLLGATNIGYRVGAE